MFLISQETVPILMPSKSLLRRRRQETLLEVETSSLILLRCLGQMSSGSYKNAGRRCTSLKQSHACIRKPFHNRKPENQLRKRSMLLVGLGIAWY